MGKLHLLRIRKEERWLALMALLLFAAQNALLVYRFYPVFTRAGRIGFWSLFFGHFHVSGFDALTYIYLSNGKIYYILSRHPLLGPLLDPLYRLNDWLMFEYHFNFAMFIMAVILVFCAVFSAIYLFRIFHHVIGIRRGEAVVLTFFFFGFAMVMLSVMVPDHFCLSLYLLTMTLYIAGMKMKQRRPMRIWQIALLTFFTAGITLSNVAKTWLAALFANGRQLFRPATLVLGIILPCLVLGYAYYDQYENNILPLKHRGEEIARKKEKTDKKFVEKTKKHDQWVDRIKGKPLGEEGVLEWTDISTSRVDAVVENLFGESIQLHEKHLLEDVFRSRPVVVRYGHWWPYAVEGVIVLVFLAGICFGFRERFLQLALSWFAFDMFLHLVLGFGLNEVYIMAAHWIFIIPIAIAYLLKHLPDHLRTAFLVLLVFLTLYLWFYNGFLIADFMSHQLTFLPKR